MASAELVKITHPADERIQNVGNDVQGVGKIVQIIDGRVKGVDHNVEHVKNKVQGVGGKLDQINRSLSLNLPALYSGVSPPRPPPYSQGTSSGIVFYDGFRPQIHLLIIIWHAKFITRVQLNGSFRALSSISGSPMIPSRGSMENVRPSSHLPHDHSSCPGYAAGSGKTILWSVLPQLIILNIHIIDAALQSFKTSRP